MYKNDVLTGPISSITSLYLKNLKHTLIDFHRLDGIQYIPLAKRHSGLVAALLKPIMRLINRLNYDLVQVRKFDLRKRINGEDWPENAESMIGLKRMNNIQYCIEQIVKDNIEGDLIETGVWRGGASIFMKANLLVQGSQKRIFVCDSFEGLPRPTHKEDKGDIHYTHHQYLAVAQEQVAKNFQKYGLLDDNIIFKKGWFKDTMPSLRAEKFSLIRLDGDMYESTMDVLQNIYDNLSVGGYVIVDDWALPGCQKAVTDFRAERNLTEKLVTIDNIAVYWRKEK
ncbi:MAG: macrocin O-methyltransferase [Bacteroidetes bacterium]|nr:MAG: macrocin O-methyltransferase [Bacteroidota bacterium]